MDVQLARLLAARLCHDLGGAVGTVAGTLDLAAEGGGAGDDGMLDLARTTAATLRGRLRLLAAAWGGMAEEADAGTLGRLLDSSTAAARVRFLLDGLSPGRPLPARCVPLALNAALLAAEALPRGGTVTLAGSAGTGLVVRPDGREAAWPPGLLALLAGGEPGAALRDGPRRILAPLLLALLAEAGWTAALAPGGAGPAAPLLLGPA